MKSIEDFEDLYQAACKALDEHNKKTGAVSQQPSAALCEIGRKYVYLKNVNGLLAKYDIQKKAIITD